MAAVFLMRFQLLLCTLGDLVMRWWMGRDSLIEGSGEITEMPLLSFSCGLMEVVCPL